MTKHWALATATITLTAITGLAGCGDNPVQAEQPRTEPIDARTVAAITRRHLGSTQLGAAQGHDEVSESGDEEVHLAIWGVLASDDFVVAVAAPEDDRLATCREIEAEDHSVTTCETRDVDGTDVLVVSSTTDIMGAGMAGGVTWSALRLGDESASSASIMVDADVVRREPGAKTGEDLPVSIERLVEIVADPDLSMKTTAEAVQEGERLSSAQFRS